MHVVILGNGVAGITAARHIRKRDSDSTITVISKESKYFFSRTALMYIYMGHMKMEHTQPYEPFFWKKNRIDLIQDQVTQVDFEKQELQLSQEAIAYDVLILATGSKPNKFGWPGQDLKGVGGLYSLQDLEALEKRSDTIERGVIVGGGLIGIELAEMLLSRNKKVSFLVRETSFWGNVLSEEEAAMVAQHMTEDHHVDLRLGVNLGEIKSDAEGYAKSIVVKETEEEIPCEYVGLTAGVSPNIDFLKESGLETDRGILVDRYLKTNFNNVYAIGDCAQFREPLPNRRPIEQVWYTGRMMGETVAKTICGKPTQYNPGPWFNSAKFMDIEYQTYGTVPARLEEGQKQFFWKHPNEYIAVRVVFDAQSNQFIGINTFGLRMRHPCFDAWLREEKDVFYVMEHLHDANFDPEFYRNYESDILAAFNQQEGTSIQPKKKSWKRLLQVLTPQYN